MKKACLSVYLDPAVLTQVAALAERKNESRSLIVEAAILSFLTPDDADRRDATIIRRLDLLTRHSERLERDLSVTAETLALFIRFWLTVAPSLPEGAQEQAQAKGRERFELFLDALGRRLVKGKGFLREVSFDRPGAPAAATSNKGASP